MHWRIQSICTHTHTAKCAHLNITLRGPFIFHTSRETVDEFTAFNSEMCSCAATHIHTNSGQGCVHIHTGTMNALHMCRQAHNHTDKTDQQLNTAQCIWIVKSWLSCRQCHQSQSCCFFCFFFSPLFSLIWVHGERCISLASLSFNRISRHAGKAAGVNKRKPLPSLQQSATTIAQITVFFNFVAVCAV